MYGIDDDRPVFSRAMALAGRMFIETIPQWLAVGAMLSLIFGGCCSNVFALESIIKVEPASGMSSSRLYRARRPKWRRRVSWLVVRMPRKFGDARSVSWS